jgi:hypothetical protein
VLGLDRPLHCSARRREGDEHRVALATLLNTEHRAHGGPDDGFVPLEHRIKAGAEATNERGRALDVGEQQAPHGQSAIRSILSDASTAVHGDALLGSMRDATGSY